MKQDVKIEGQVKTAMNGDLVLSVNNLCDDCKLEINQFMMTDRCWEEVAKSDEVLCWGCFRIRIDRRIFPGDFMECEANEPFLTYIKEALFQESKDFAEANLPKSSGPMARP